MRRISESERRGMIVLALMALAMIGGSFAWRSYVSRNASEARDMLRIVGLPADSVATGVGEDSADGAEESVKKRKKRKPGGRSTSRRRPRSASGAATLNPRDPLRDTIPTRGDRCEPKEVKIY